MKVHILGSSSKGNCYILESSTEALIVEVGLPPVTIKKALQWNLKKIVGALISHSHDDHAGFISEITDLGVTTLALQDVFKSHGISGKPFTKEIEPLKRYKLGGFMIQGVSVPHDVPCLSFVITHQDMGKLLFVTDAVTFGYKVSQLNHVMIEANYADDILSDNIANEVIPPSMRPRLLKSHMEIGTTKEVLSEQDLSMVDNIILIHLSRNNSDASRFIKEVQESTGKSVYVADHGMVLDLSVNPY